jgi:predicted phosphate transport protein (TIGR00153 family)
MHPLAALFGTSPFGPLVEHARKVHECVLLVRTIAEAWLAGRFDQLDDLRSQMSKTEHEADEIKSKIREHLPKSIFLPVNRADLLNYLKAQDGVADAAKDFAVLLTFRRTEMPAEFHTHVREYVEKVVSASDALCQLAEQVDELIRSAMSGPKAEEALRRAQEIAHMEWEADKIERHLLQEMFKQEDRIGPISVLMIMKILDALGRLANAAENTADLLRMMILTR